MKNVKCMLAAAFAGLVIGAGAVMSDEELSRWVYDTSHRVEPTVWAKASASSAINPCGSVLQTGADASVDGIFLDSEKSVEVDVSLEDFGILLIIR